MRDNKPKRTGRGKTGRRRKETRQENNYGGKQAEKLEFENGQEMNTNGPVLCVEDLRLAAHRRLPLSAGASKNKNKHGGKVEATMEKKTKRMGGGRNRRAGKGGGRRGRENGRKGGLWTPYRQPSP